MSRVLRKLVEWESHGERFGTIPLPISLMARILDNLTPAQAQELGRWVGIALLEETVPAGAAGGPGQAHPASSAGKVRPGRAISFDLREDGAERVVVLKHSGGEKWTAYYDGMLRAVIKDTYGEEPDVERSPLEIKAKVRPQ